MIITNNNTVLMVSAMEVLWKKNTNETSILNPGGQKATEWFKCFKTLLSSISELKKKKSFIQQVFIESHYCGDIVSK